jgi:uncharacterized RDD family membrane protein YckC
MATALTQPDPTSVVGRRVLAVLLDGLLIVVPWLLIASSAFQYLDEDDLDRSPSQFCEDFMELEDGVCAHVGDRVYFAYGDETELRQANGYYLLANALLLVVLQGFTGWTPGKLVAGIRVMREDGRRPGFVKALLRWLLWLVDGFPYCIPGLTGFIVALTTPGHRRVGDIVAKTVVVKRSAAGTPITIGEGGRLIIGADAAPEAPLDWSAPAATAGWGPAVDPAPAPAPSAAPGVGAPQWDEARNTYIQWDPQLGAWMQWDEATKAWVRIPGQ